MKSGKSLVGLVGIAVLASAATAQAGAVRGQGRVVYYESGANGGTVLPMTGVRVHLIDDDGAIGDDTLKTGYTDASGNFDLSANSGDGLLGGKLDPYIQVELESSAGKVVVESEILKVNVTCSTPVRDETEGNINFGTIYCSSANGKDASSIFAHIGKAYGTFTAQTGQSTIPRHSGKAAALFPVVLAAGVPWTTEESIHWPGGFRDFKAVYHEFGHRIRHAQDGDFVHFLSDVSSYSYLQQHWTDKVTNEGFAFNEGWAEYNATLTDPAQASTFSKWDPSKVSKGSNTVEGNVAARLFKLSRDCGGFKRMWSTLQTGGIHSYNQFSIRLQSEFQASAALRAQFPQCLSTAIALNESAPASDWDFAHDHAPDMVASNASSELGLVGASAPAGPADVKTALADQSNLVSNLGDEVKARAAKHKSRNVAVNNAKLKVLGGKLASDRDDFERRSAAKFDKHVKNLKPLDGSKDALARRRAENAAFVKDILSDRITTLEAQLTSVKSELTKATGAEAQGLNQIRTKLERNIADLKEAVRTGNVELRHLPHSFSLTAESTP